MDALTIVAVVAYLLVTCFLGYLGYRQTKTAADYLVAGRSASPLVMALSYGATFISTSAIVGFGGVAANLGMGLLWLTVLNIFVGIFIAFVFLGGATRRMGHHLDAHTFPELLGKRFDSRVLQIITGLIIFIFMPLYAMAVMLGMAQFLSNQFVVSLDVALFICAGIVALYVIAGGLKGVMLTDALQGLIMLVGMILLLVVTYAKLGGVTAAHQALTDMGDKVPAALKSVGHQGWTSMPAFGWATPGASDAHRYDLWWTMVTTIVMGVGIGVLAQPQLIVRFMTVKSRQSLNRAVMAGGVFILFMTGVAFVTGALSNAYFVQKEEIKCKIVNDRAWLCPDPNDKGLLKELPAETDPKTVKDAVAFVAYRLPHEKEDQAPHYVLRTPKTVITLGASGTPDVIRPGLIGIARSIGPGTTMKGDVDRIIPRFVESALPRWFGVVFLLTLLSAAMSTMSSQFHTMGSAIGRDVFEQVTRRSGSTILITRLGIILGIIAALVTGYCIRGNIIALATSIFFGLCAASFLPAFVLGLFWRRMNKVAAISSMMVGFLVSLFWNLFVNLKVADGVGICKKLFNHATLVPADWSVTWNVVDPLVVALPLAALTAIVMALLTKPMDPAHVAYVFGGQKPKA